MENKMGIQLELFSQSKDKAEIINPSASSSFLRAIWAYEKTILIIIGLVITSIISFSLGVEKGKKVSILRNNFQVNRDLSPKSMMAPENQAQSLPTKKEEVIKEIPLLEKQNYVIQLASYKARSSAQREMELLKKKGLSASVLPKGSYIVLYVGKFSNRENAQNVLPELKKRYRDCYIRRL